MKITLEQATEAPDGMLALALQITQKRDLDNLGLFSKRLAKYLLDADHTSPFEHVVYSFRIEGVSRSFLAQITRHRMGSFTAASQHYQEYGDYPCIIKDKDDELTQKALLQSYLNYHKLIKDGAPVWEARQVLPNAASVNILWTVNARALVNFLQQRLCYRNVMEMQIFADKILNLVSAHFPELWNCVGPQCFMDKCKQGPMKCSVGPWVRWGDK